MDKSRDTAGQQHASGYAEQTPATTSGFVPAGIGASFPTAMNAMPNQLGGLERLGSDGHNRFHLHQPVSAASTLEILNRLVPQQPQFPLGLVPDSSSFLRTASSMGRPEMFPSAKIPEIISLLQALVRAQQQTAATVSHAPTMARALPQQQQQHSALDLASLTQLALSNPLQFQHAAHQVQAMAHSPHHPPLQPPPRVNCVLGLDASSMHGLQSNNMLQFMQNLNAPAGATHYAPVAPSLNTSPLFKDNSPASQGGGGHWTYTPVVSPAAGALSRHTVTALQHTSSNKSATRSGGRAGRSMLFPHFLQDMEERGIIKRQFGHVPAGDLHNVTGWVVCEGRKHEWDTSREEWFMKNKNGREFKKNSFNQMLRRLGYLPIKKTSKGSHGVDFDSDVFTWRPQQLKWRPAGGPGEKDDSSARKGGSSSGGYSSDEKDDAKDKYPSSSSGPPSGSGFPGAGISGGGSSKDKDVKLCASTPASTPDASRKRRAWSPSDQDTTGLTYKGATGSSGSNGGASPKDTKLFKPTSSSSSQPGAGF